MRRDETKIHVEEQEVSIIRHAAGVFFSDDQFTPDGGANAKLIRYGGISGADQARITFVPERLPLSFSRPGPQWRL